MVRRPLLQQRQVPAPSTAWAQRGRSVRGACYGWEQLPAAAPSKQAPSTSKQQAGSPPVAARLPRLAAAPCAAASLALGTSWGARSGGRPDSRSGRPGPTRVQPDLPAYRRQPIHDAAVLWRDQRHGRHGAGGAVRKRFHLNGPAEAAAGRLGGSGLPPHMLPHSRAPAMRLACTSFSPTGLERTGSRGRQTDTPWRVASPLCAAGHRQGGPPCCKGSGAAAGCSPSHAPATAPPCATLPCTGSLPQPTHTPSPARPSPPSTGPPPPTHRYSCSILISLP